MLTPVWFSHIPVRGWAWKDKEHSVICDEELVADGDKGWALPSTPYHTHTHCSQPFRRRTMIWIASNYKSGIRSMNEFHLLSLYSREGPFLSLRPLSGYGNVTLCLLIGKTNYIQHLWCISHFFNHFIHINFSNLRVLWESLIIPFCRWINWGIDVK